MFTAPRQRSVGERERPGTAVRHGLPSSTSTRTSSFSSLRWRREQLHAPGRWLGPGSSAWPRLGETAAKGTIWSLHLTEVWTVQTCRKNVTKCGYHGDLTGRCGRDVWLMDKCMHAFASWMIVFGYHWEFCNHVLYIVLDAICKRNSSLLETWRTSVAESRMFYSHIRLSIHLSVITGPPPVKRSGPRSPDTVRPPITLSARNRCQRQQPRAGASYDPMRAHRARSHCIYGHGADAVWLFNVWPMTGPLRIPVEHLLGGGGV